MQRRYKMGTQNCGIHEFEIFWIEQELALLWYRHLLFGNRVWDRVEGNEMRPSETYPRENPCILQRLV